VSIWHHGEPFPPSGQILLVPLDKGTMTQKSKAMQEAFHAYDGQVVILCSYESSWREPLASHLAAANFNLLVMDEGHKLQAAGSQVSWFFKRLGKTVDKKIALTGTPAPNGPDSVYGLFRALDPSIFGTSHDEFRSKYCIMGGYEKHQIVGYRNLEEFNRRFNSITVSVDRSVLHLPKETVIQRTSQLSPSAQKMYDSMEKDMIAQVGTGVVTAKNAGVKLLRLSQLTGGWLTPEKDMLNDGVVPVEVDTEKKKLCGEVLDELDINEPVVIFYRFIRDSESIRDICKKQGRSYHEVSGQRSELDEWKKNGQVLGVQISSGSEGIDLTKAAYCIYYSVGFSLFQYEQSTGRINRPGQVRPVTYIQLVMKNTIDEDIYESIAAKKDIVEWVLDKRFRPEAQPRNLKKGKKKFRVEAKMEYEEHE
jgi:SNF2 family DNA or RNA helicase